MREASGKSSFCPLKPNLSLHLALVGKREAELQEWKSEMDLKATFTNPEPAERPAQPVIAPPPDDPPRPIMDGEWDYWTETHYGQVWDVWQRRGESVLGWGRENVVMPKSLTTTHHNT